MLGCPAFGFAGIALAAGLRLDAQSELIPAGEFLVIPTPARLSALTDTDANDHWGEIAMAAQAASFSAYQKNQLNAAEAWHYVESWADLYAERELEFIPRWMNAVETAQVAHANMAQRYTLRENRLGQSLALS